jgi:hypothetical protein
MATCPNCKAVIAWSVDRCAACGALFGGDDAWRPLPESVGEKQSIAARYPAKAPLWVPGIASVFKSAAFVGAGATLATAALAYVVSQTPPPLSGALVVGAFFGLLTAIWYVLLLLVLPLLRLMGMTAGALAGLLVSLIFFLPPFFLVIAFVAGGWLLIPVTIALGWAGQRLFLTPRSVPHH